jgi:flagellar motility protein MotE (MotC chaperone)
MKQSGYDAFFKAAKNNAQKSVKPKFDLTRSPAPKGKKNLSDYSEKELRKIFKMDPDLGRARAAKKKSSSVSLTQVMMVMALLAASAGTFLFPDEVTEFVGRIRLSATTAASAQDSAKSTASEAASSAKPSPDGSVQSEVKAPDAKSWSEEDISYFSKLNDRKQQLDLREKELEELEQELNKQRVEVESRIQYLETVRRDIAGVLKDRVEVDQEKVMKLVEFYSNMKPAQAAQIISNLNEDLAIGVLSNMKKKNAAEIMNMLEPTKAQALSEKFAGYTKLQQ